MKKPGVTVTKSGLQYQVLTPGKGARPHATSTVKVNYVGTLTTAASLTAATSAASRQPSR